MHNPTRRSKRFRRPLDTRGLDPPGETSPVHVQHRRVVPPDTLRGAVLVALVVVTIVLYVILWELERSSFASVPFERPSLNQSTMAASSSTGISTRYPHEVVLDEEALRTGEAKLRDERIAVPSSRATPEAWPPPITHVPEEHDADDLAETVDDRTHQDENTKQLSSFDAGYCNGACRFLLPARVGEQESKARVHFMQLVMLARRLERTIVLPNVGKSRMSACSKWPFDSYYDPSVFAHGDGSPDPWRAVDLERFSNWVNERPVPPNSFVVSMDSIPRGRHDPPGTQVGSEDIPFIVERAEIDARILSCLESKLPRLRASLPETSLSIQFDAGSLKADSDAGSPLVQLLSSSLDADADSDFNPMAGTGYEYIPQYINASYVSLADVDVLVLDYDLRRPLFSAPEEPGFNLHYAPALYDIADRLADNLAPFLGVHWRMETVPAQNLAWCAASLVSTLHGLLQDDVTGKSVRHVWLATDHPRALSSFVGDDGDDGGRPRNYGPVRKSGTFKALSPEHDDAIGTLTEAFQPGGDLDAWKLTALAEQLRRYPYVEGKLDVDEALLNDPGAFGILDKLVIVQARAFVSGSTDCSKTSSFSKQVIEARRESFEAEGGKGAICNVVEYFGEW